MRVLFVIERSTQDVPTIRLGLLRSQAINIDLFPDIVALSLSFLFELDSVNIFKKYVMRFKKYECYRLLKFNVKLYKN